MYLPLPPSNVQKFLYIRSGRTKLYLVSLASTIVLMTGMLLFVKQNPSFFLYTIFFALTFSYLFFSYLIGIAGKDFDTSKHVLLVNKWLDKSANTEIDIYLPVCGEAMEVLLNTWKGVYKMALAHEGKIKVHVLDDAKSDLVKKQAESMGFNYITRPDNTLKKAGNLRNAFSKTTAPYFMILDVDFVPREDMIINLMPYFFEDENTCIVQSPQFFEVTEDQTPVQRGAGSIQELFYRLIQVSRDTFRGAICVGSNAIYSRKHLEPYGGTAAIGYSEDVRTSYRLSADGKTVKYIPINLALGICPENWKQLFTQYYRWSMGSLDLMLSKEFWRKGLTTMQRACYLSGMFYYLTTGLSAVFIGVPSIYLLIFKPDLVKWYNLFFSVPSLFLSTVYMKYWMRLPYDVSAIRVRQVSFFAHLFALKDLLLNTMEPWQPTGGTSKSNRYNSFCVFYIFMTISVPLIISVLMSLRIIQGYDPVNFVLLFLITAYHTYLTVPIIDEL